MKKILPVLIAATVVGAAALATLNTAEARWGYGAYRGAGYRGLAYRGYGYRGYGYRGYPPPGYRGYGHGGGYSYGANYGERWRWIRLHRVLRRRTPAPPLVVAPVVDDVPVSYVPVSYVPAYYPAISYSYGILARLRLL